MISGIQDFSLPWNFCCKQYYQQREETSYQETIISRYVRLYFLVHENTRNIKVRGCIEIIGNVPDTRAKMTMMSQRKNIKWFFTMLK